LKGHGLPITGIVTEARFDTSEAVPVLKFRAVRPLTREEWNTAKAQSEGEEAKQAIDFKMVPSKAESAPALPAAFKNTPVITDETEEVAAEPVKEPVKRTVKPKVEVKPEVAKNVADILNDWSTDEDE
jgi:hypothetical protein